MEAAPSFLFVITRYCHVTAPLVCFIRTGKTAKEFASFTPKPF